MSAASLDNIFGDTSAPIGNTPAAASLDNIFGSPSKAAPSDKSLLFKANTPAPDLSGKSLDLSPFSAADTQPKDLTKITSTAKLATPAPLAQVSDTSKIGSAFLKANQLPLTVKTSTASTIDKSQSQQLEEKGSEVVSKAINDAVIQYPADLLANTSYGQGLAERIDNGKSQGLFQKLSLGLAGLSGLTGGLYQTPQQLQMDNDPSEAPAQDLADKGIQTIAQGLGMAVGIGLVGEVAGGTRIAGTAVETLAGLANKFPLIGKYISPYIEPLVENTAGFAAYGQLDPKLGTDITARAQKFALDVGTAPFYTALGMIKNPVYSLPASFGLGFSMAKLSGADNQTAVSSGTAFAFLDAIGRATGNRGNTPEEQKRLNDEKNLQEALNMLQPYSKIKLTVESSPEDIKAAYYKGAHATHPDTGGTSEQFNAVKNAYDLLSKGGATRETEAEKSIKILSTDIKDGMEKFGEGPTHEALKENLKVDANTADKLIRGAKASKTPEEAKAASEKVLRRIAPKKEPLEGVKINPAEEKSPIPKELEPLAEEAKKYKSADEFQAAVKNGDITTPGIFIQDETLGKGGWTTGRVLRMKKEGVPWYEVTRPGESAKEAQPIMASKTEMPTGGFPLADFYKKPEAEKTSEAVKISDLEPGARNFSDSRNFPEDAEDAKTVDRYKGQIEKGEPIKPIKVTKMPDGRMIVNDGHHRVQAAAELGKEEILAQVSKAERLVTSQPQFSLLSDSEKIAIEKAKKDGGLFIDKPIEKLKDNFNPEAGFINVGKIVEDADAKVQDFIETTLKPIELASNLTDSFIKLEGAAQADLESVSKLVDSLDIKSKDDEALYEHAENPGAKLTDKQEALVKKFDDPLKKINEELFKRIKGDGFPLDESNNYISRFPKEKPSVLQRVFKPVKGKKSTASQGGILSKSAPSLKHRVMKALVDEEGNRLVVSIKDGQVTRFFNKDSAPMGTIKRVVTNKKLMEGEIQPLQKHIDDFEKQIATIRRIKIGDPVSKARIARLEKQIAEVSDYIDRNVGAFTAKEFKPDLARLDKLEATLKTLSSVKTAGQISNTQAIVGKLEDAIRDVSNKIGEIESKYASTLNSKVFKADNGKSYRIDEATTQEIEKHTDIEYYHSAVASRLMQYVKLRQIDRANQFIESWKNSPQFGEVAVPSSEIPPEGWRLSNSMYFRNYFFEPRTAEILDDMQTRLNSGVYNDAFTGINRTLADAIFFNGLAHPINVATTWAYNRGVSGIVYPPKVIAGVKAFGRALEAMRTKNSDYMELLRNGAHLMSSDVTNKTLAEKLTKKLSEELEAKPDIRDAVIKALGYAGDFASFKRNVIYKLSHDMAWLSNDFLTMQSIFETMDTQGLTMEEAIKETARFIPDYRQKSRLLDKPLSAIGGDAGAATARVAAKLIYNRNVDMFASYHIGLLESLKNAVLDTTKGSDWTFGADSMKTRARGIDKLAMLALLGLVIYPYLDKLAQKITGNPNTYITRSGIVKYPFLAYKWASGQTSTSQALQSIITPAVGTEAGVELFFNRDLFTGNNIYGVGGEGIGGFLADKVAPISEGKKIATGKLTPGSFAATLLGVHTPNNTQLGLDLNAMIYTEKPQVAKEMKTRITAGDTQGAQTIGHEFNTRLAAQIKAADIAGGNSGSDARVAYFVNQYGVKMPGTDAMDNFTAKQGQNIVQKTLPNGKPVVAKSTPLPATGVIGVITTYAKAIGSDPITAFKDIFSGQSIRQVTNGVIIVNRMALSDSQAQRQNDATAQGLSTPKGMNLDHIVPLEAGGDNGNDNLQLIPQAQWEANSPVENYLGTQLKEGSLTGAQVRELAIRFKAGNGEILSPALMAEYRDKYGSQPMSAQDVYNYVGK